MAKKETIPTIIDTPEALTAKMAAMKEAQKIFATYTQEQVDKIFKAAATAADKMRIPLAKMADDDRITGFQGNKRFIDCCGGRVGCRDNCSDQSYRFQDLLESVCLVFFYNTTCLSVLICIVNILCCIYRRKKDKPAGPQTIII